MATRSQFKTTKTHGLHIKGTGKVGEGLGGISFNNLSDAPAPTDGYTLYVESGLLKFWDGSSETTLGAAGAVSNFSLNDAYDDGSTVTVDSSAVTLNGVNMDTAVLALTGDGDSAGALITFAHTTATRNDVLGTGSSWAVTGQGNATFNSITMGDDDAITLGASSDAIIKWVGASNYIDIEGATNFDGDMIVEAAHTVTIAGAGGSTKFDVTAGDVTIQDGSIALTDADNAETFTLINNTATTIGAAASAALLQVESTSLTTGAAVNVQLTEGTLNGGFYYSGWDATAGARVFSVGEDGAVVITGNGGSNMLTVTAGDAVMSDGSLTITDADNAATVAVTNNTATTVGASSSTGVANVISTSLTTGTLLNLQLTEGTLNGGWYLRGWDATAGAAVFSVGEDGLTTIAGNASGTDALVLTAGDILVTSGHIDMTVGDLTLADGSVTLTDADNAASLGVTNNTITTADALVDIASTSLTTGAMLRINANTDAHDGEILELISSGDTTSTPTGMSVVIAEPTTGAAHGINVTMVGATTGPVGLKITMDAITESSMVYLDNGGNSLTTGYFINCNDDGSVKFGVGANGAVTIAGAGGSTVHTITAGDAVMSDGSLAITDADNAETVTIINNTATTIGAAASAAVVQLESTSLTTGALLGLQLTEGTLNGGWYVRAWDATAGAAVFSVGEDGATVMGTLLHQDFTEVVTGTNTITAAESGTVFFLNSATEFASTLPAPAAGLHFTFIVTAAPSGASYTIATNGGANVIYGQATVNGAAVPAVQEDTITFTDGAAAIGDYVELWCDGTNWYVTGQGVAATAIAFTAA